MKPSTAFSHLASKWPVGLCLLAAVLWHSQLASYSDGPPTGRTGAPGELTCYNGSCHNSFPLNSGPGEARLSINIPESGYVPGATYEITASIRQDSMLRFGMEMMVYSPINDGSIGMLNTPEDSTGLELVSDNGREYIRHFDATEATDSNSWKINWTAPPVGTGEIVLHSAFVASNRNGNRQGDYVYKTQLPVAESTDSLATSISQFESGQDVRVSTSASHLILSLYLPSHTFLDISLVDIRGRQSYHLLNVGNPGEYHHQISLATIPSGMYLLLIRNERKPIARKILIP